MSRPYEKTEEFPDLVAYWSEQGYRYDTKIGVFLKFDEYKGTTDWFIGDKAMDKALERME